jgi:hypothetical protein
LAINPGHGVTLAFRRGHVIGFDQQGARVSIGAK